MSNVISGVKKSYSTFKDSKLFSGTNILSNKVTVKNYPSENYPSENYPPKNDPLNNNSLFVKGDKVKHKYSSKDKKNCNVSFNSFISSPDFTKSNCTKYDSDKSGYLSKFKSHRMATQHNVNTQYSKCNSGFNVVDSKHRKQTGMMSSVRFIKQSNKNLQESVSFQPLNQLSKNQVSKRLVNTSHSFNSTGDNYARDNYADVNKSVDRQVLIETLYYKIDANISRLNKTNNSLRRSILFLDRQLGRVNFITFFIIGTWYTLVSFFYKVVSPVNFFFFSLVFFVLFTSINDFLKPALYNIIREFIDTNAHSNNNYTKLVPLTTKKIESIDTLENPPKN